MQRYTASQRFGQNYNTYRFVCLKNLQISEIAKYVLYFRFFKEVTFYFDGSFTHFWHSLSELPWGSHLESFSINGSTLSKILVQSLAFLIFLRSLLLVRGTVNSVLLIYTLNLQGYHSSQWQGHVVSKGIHSMIQFNLCWLNNNNIAGWKIS